MVKFKIIRVVKKYVKFILLQIKTNGMIYEYMFLLKKKKQLKN